MLWIFWVSRGWGSLALGTPLLLSLMLWADDTFQFLPNDGPATKWIFVTILFASGLLASGLGLYLNRGPGSWAIDPTTGLEYFDTWAKHSMYYVPLQYWGLFYCLLAVSAVVAFR
jgi:hypothetical protein